MFDFFLSFSIITTLFDLCQHWFSLTFNKMENPIGDKTEYKEVPNHLWRHQSRNKPYYSKEYIDTTKCFEKIRAWSREANNKKFSRARWIFPPSFITFLLVRSSQLVKNSSTIDSLVTITSGINSIRQIMINHVHFYLH